MTIRTNIKLIGLILSAVFLVCQSHAHAPMSRQANGVIQNIDWGKHTIQFLPDQKTKPVVFEWKSYTKILANGKTVQPDVLKIGQTARISYRSPFFGKPFVTKVVLNPE